MKMKKTDIGVVAVMYVIAGAFYYYMTKLDPDSQTYPKFTIILLFGLTTIYLLQMIVAAKKHGVVSGKDEVFPDFQPKQFAVCVGAVIGYLVLMYFAGFYISTVIFMAGVLLYLKVPYLTTAIALAVIVLLVYFAFTKFLGVKLPQGLVFKLLS